MISKRHHYVSQFYLNYFCASGFGLWVYEKALAQPRFQRPQNTAVEKDLYSFTIDGRKDDFVERRLSELESAAKPILDRWQQYGALPNPEEMQIVAMFLALMYVRVPRMIETIREGEEIRARETFKLFAEVRSEEVEELLQAAPPTLWGKSKPTAKEFVRYLDENYRIVVNREASVAESLRLAPATLNKLLEMDWCLCDAPKGKFFLTSDTPLCVFARASETKALFVVRLGLPNVEVTFPISPRLCLLLNRGHSGGPRRTVTAAVVRQLNARMITTAERFIYSPEQSSWVGELVSRSRSHKPKLDRNEFGSKIRTSLRDWLVKDTKVIHRAD
jgi:hypothetical protein